MVLKSHDLSDVSVIRSHQNGSCSSNGASDLPLKWKPRSISAVRDFPRGCGPVVESVSHDVSKSTEDGKTGLLVDLDLHKESQKGDNQAMVKDEISDPVDAAIEVDDNGGKLIKEYTRKMKFPQRRVSAVRDFPPYCGLNATEPTKEERIRINGKRSERLIDSVVVGGEESNGSVKDNSLQKTQSNESNESLMENQANKGDKKPDTESQIIKKVCQELVVYTRDKDQKKKSLIDASDEDSEENLEDESFHKSETEDVMPIRTLAPVKENKKNASVTKKRSMDDVSNLGFVKGERIVVMGLVAPSFTPTVFPSIMPKRSNSEVGPSITPNESKSEATPSIKPMKSKSEAIPSITVTPNESKSEATPSIKSKKSKSEMVPSKTPKKSKSEAMPSVTPNESKSEATPSIKSKKSKSETVPSKTPKKSKSEAMPSVTPNESKSEATPSIKSKKSKSEMVPSKTPKKSKSEAMPSITPNESKSEAIPKESKSEVITSVKPKKSKSKKVKAFKESTSIYSGTLDMVMRDEDEEEPLAVETEEQGEEFPNSHEVDVALPPFGPRSSNSARNRIRETLRLFQALCRKLLQNEESKTNQNDDSKPLKRVDLVARAILQEKGKAPDRGKKTYGSVPGVEVGDEFQYRVELALVGIHWPFQSGIDYIKHGKSKTAVAVSVVASGGYDNELGKPDCLIYSGSGGIRKNKQIEDQKLERGNVALKNNIDLKIPVRVIRGYKGKSTDSSSSSSSSDSKSKIQTTYIYDGLYTVEEYRQEKGPLGNLVFKFELKRIPGQPELAIREVKSKKFKVREGICVDDIANGKEKKRVSAVNTIDDEKPPFFNYITKIVYPDWFRHPVPPTGCDCVGRCSGKRCKCAAKNGGEIPYNHNGAIVEAKPLVYECGPSCKCPPSCYNRVTQNGMKIQLEIFKTESRGWGVRSLTSISSGSFICEYVGELLEDTEAEKRTGNDEYLFDIGQNYSDTGMGSGMGMDVVSDSGGFTIDAANYGNVGRFINHSCTPNLYAQNVLYDQEDKRMPHIMLFAAENIPPLQELTYHYNYAVDTVHDKDGNIKVKRCFCGSSECTGRLY